MVEETTLHQDRRPLPNKENAASIIDKDSLVCDFQKFRMARVCQPHPEGWTGTSNEQGVAPNSSLSISVIDKEDPAIPMFIHEWKESKRERIREDAYPVVVNTGGQVLKFSSSQLIDKEEKDGD